MTGNEADREKSAMRELLNAKTDEQELSPSKTGTATLRFVVFSRFPVLLAAFTAKTPQTARKYRERVAYEVA